MILFARSDTHEMVNLLLGEFRIKHCELQFDKTLQTGPMSTISQGRWHGEVVIHSCAPHNDQEVQGWLADVRALTHIRHENVVLYMGACVEPPKFAIITSPIKVRTFLRGFKQKILSSNSENFSNNIDIDSTAEYKIQVTKL